jgi:hypothetical protein
MNTKILIDALYKIINNIPVEKPNLTVGKEYIWNTGDLDDAYDLGFEDGEKETNWNHAEIARKALKDYEFG